MNKFALTKEIIKLLARSLIILRKHIMLEKLAILIIILLSACSSDTGSSDTNGNNYLLNEVVVWDSVSGTGSYQTGLINARPNHEHFFIYTNYSFLESVQVGSSLSFIVSNEEKKIFVISSYEETSDLVSIKGKDNDNNQFELHYFKDSNESFGYFDGFAFDIKSDGFGSFARQGTIKDLKIFHRNPR